MNTHTAAETVLMLQNHAIQSLKDWLRKATILEPQKVAQNQYLSEYITQKYL